ncbi:hypothetical protein [Thermoactinomyces mirandus]|uniref:Uncharacterized protein n=1 Tax=Thermoactinomyces mirandus TaxID=2756294 RepID=A0A7W2APR6_9BACL|nr:hypothetical protein [Thermoactinomyces mirandus]MBA4601219.1 hypothetical protein [Thermoactinomyces mirandus]
MEYKVFDLKINKEMVKELNNANKIEIYLFQATKNKVYQDTYSCTEVYLKVGKSQFFRIEGIAENYGSYYDEVFSIILQRGWFKFDGYEEMEDSTNLYLYDVFMKNDAACIEVKSSSETFENKYKVEADQGLLFRRKNQSIFIGLDDFPFNIIVTKDKEYIKELEKWWD